MVLTDRNDAGTRLPSETAPLQRSGLRTQIGNTATEFDAAWHGLIEIRPVNRSFLKERQQYRADPTDENALIHDLRLLDAKSPAQIRDRRMSVVRPESNHHPLFDDPGDETSIADFSAFCRFDGPARSIARMRVGRAAARGCDAPPGRADDLAHLAQERGLRREADDLGA